MGQDVLFIQFTCYSLHIGVDCQYFWCSHSASHLRKWHVEGSVVGSSYLP